MQDRPASPSSRRGWRWALCAILLLPFLAHVAELSGLADTDPLLFISSLARHPQSGLVGGKPFLDGNAAQTTLALGHLAAEDWLGGHLPWWNPYTGVGLPLASEMQPAAFFLPFILLLHFPHGIVLLKIAMQIMAGGFTLAFLRRLGIGLWAATLGGVFFAFNGSFAWFSDAPMLPVAFLPLLLLGIEAARSRAQLLRPGGLVVVALAIAGALLAGFPEVAYVDGLMGLAWAVARGWALPRRQRAWFALSIAAGGVTGLLLAAPGLLAFLLDLRFTTIGLHADSASHTLGLSHAVGLFFPYVFGNLWANENFQFWIRSGGYVGLVLPALACVALLAWRRQAAERLFFAGWIVIVTAAMFHVTVITGLLRLLPGLHDTELGRYAMASVAFAACCLAARALDDYARAGRLELSRGQMTAAGIGMAVLLVVALNRLALQEGNTPQAGAFAACALLWGTVSFTTVLASLGRPGGRRWLAAVIVLDAVGLFAVPTLSGLADPAIKDGPTAFLRAHQGYARSMATDDTLFPNYGALVRLGMVHYEYIPIASNWADYVVSHLDPKAAPNSWPGMEPHWNRAVGVSDHFAALAAIGVKYIVSPTEMNMFNLMTRPGTPARVYRQDGEDIFELPGTAPYAAAEGGACTLQIASREEMRAECAAPATLIRRELYFPGWRVRVNGAPQPIAQAETIFQAVRLPAGRSLVAFHYAPPFSRGFWVVFAAGLAALGVGGMAGRSPARRAPEPAGR